MASPASSALPLLPGHPTSDISPGLTGSTPLSSLIYTVEPNDLPGPHFRDSVSTHMGTQQVPPLSRRGEGAGCKLLLGVSLHAWRVFTAQAACRKTFLCVSLCLEMCRTLPFSTTSASREPQIHMVCPRETSHQYLLSFIEVLGHRLLHGPAKRKLRPGRRASTPCVDTLASRGNFYDHKYVVPQDS